MKSSFKYLALTLAPLALFAEEEASSPKQPSSQYAIDGKSRAHDYLQAFDLLKKEKTANKVQFVLKDNSLITNIIDIQLMEQGSLMVFRFNTTQGIRYRVVPLEEIVRLEHQ
jgi:hypothetical protein